MDDVFGTVKVEQIERAVRIDAIDDKYNSMLLDRFLQQQMKELSKTGVCDVEGIKKALALFGISITSSSTWQGPKQAYINRKECTVSWFTYITPKGSNAPSAKKWVRHRSGTVDIDIIPIKKSKGNRRRFSELSPELQEKIRKRHPEKFR